MLHVITSNPVNIKHLKQYANNFILVHTQPRVFIPSMNLPSYQFNIYHEEGMNLEEYEEYQSDNQFQYNFLEGVQPSTIIDSIAEAILNQDIHAKALDPDDDSEEHMIAFACDYQWNQSAVKRFNSWMKNKQSEIRAVNLFTVLKVPNMKKLSEYISSALSTNYVYAEDPIAFGYAVFRVLNGMVR